MAKEIEEVTTFEVNKSSLINSFNQACEDTNFKKLVTRIKAKPEVAMKYTSKLERSVNELNNCSKCKALETCKNPLNGCVYYPTVNGNMIDFNYVQCKYKNAYDEEISNTSTTFLEPIQIKKARIKDIDLTDKKRAPLIKWIKDFFKNYQTNKNIKGIYLHGSFGCGKTYILAALLNELAKNNVKTVIIYYPEMLRNLKESFYTDFDAKMSTIKNADVLLIDDIGAESVSEWNRDEILGTILQYRMDSMLPTMFTSNLNKEELERHLSKNGTDLLKARRIMERINQLTDDIEVISKNRRM